MEIIKSIVEKIEEELEDSEKYIDCAVKVKTEYTDLAQTYYKLSLEELTHASLLHDQVVKIINNYKSEHEVPEGMKVLYDFVHERYVNWTYKIKFKQDTYKQNI